MTVVKAFLQQEGPPFLEIYKGMDIYDFVEIVILRYNPWPQFYSKMPVKKIGHLPKLWSF